MKKDVGFLPDAKSRLVICMGKMDLSNPGAGVASGTSGWFAA